MSIHDSAIIERYFMFLTVLIAFGLGSFLHCAAYRIARHEKFVKGSSQCPICGHPLAWNDLVPVFSYIFLKGKCRYCKAGISLRYVISEIAFIGLMISNLLCFDVTFVALRNAILLCCLFVIAIVDYEAYEIPNGCILISLAAWVVLEPLCYREQTRGELWVDVVEHVGTMIGILFFILLIRMLFQWILKKKALGFGDVKLLAVMGLYLGVMPALFGIILACILGLIFGVIFQKRKKERKGAYFPFGPALSAAFWIMLCVGEPFVTWYYHFFI